VFAREPGAVAAPTAGLHFDDALLARCASAASSSALVTLHVGAGTFQPVRAETSTSTACTARLNVGAEPPRADRRTRARGGRVIAVGTTSGARARSELRSGGAVRRSRARPTSSSSPGSASGGRCAAHQLPPAQIDAADAGLGAFAGATHPRAYAHAVAQRYRFFSYGDAMFIPPPTAPPAAAA
jgi:S-adenosylmethionine:tRNA ribosyltransferase-isomerase